MIYIKWGLAKVPEYLEELVFAVEQKYPGEKKKKKESDFIYKDTVKQVLATVPYNQNTLILRWWYERYCKIVFEGGYKWKR